MGTLQNQREQNLKKIESLLVINMASDVVSLRSWTAFSIGRLRSITNSRAISILHSILKSHQTFKFIGSSEFGEYPNTEKVLASGV